MTFNGFVWKQETISDLRLELYSYLIKLMEFSRVLGFYLRSKWLIEVHGCSIHELQFCSEESANSVHYYV